MQLALSGQISPTFDFDGSYISTHFIYEEYQSCDFFLMGMKFFSEKCSLFYHPLNYCYISFEYTLKIQDPVGFLTGKNVFDLARSADCAKYHITNAFDPQKTPHDPCLRPSER